jgi:hypothetical protein
MYEMMFDLETLDTKTSAVVLSVGAVIWETGTDPEGKLQWQVKDRFLRILDMDEQLARGRTVSQHTLLWWLRQSANARDEAFSPVRQPCVEVLNALMSFANGYSIPAILSETDPGITKFWASPDTFDFPIWDDLAMTFSSYVPWKYNQKRDVRTVVDEASMTASSHKDNTLVGVPHAPVYDCEWQISLLTAARNKINRRIGK